MTQFDASVRQLLYKYKYSDVCKRDISNAILQYTDLRPGNERFIFNDGSRKDLVTLDGTIPVMYKGNTYNIPICIWILDTHPLNPPMVFVKPTSTMQIKQGRNVDANGKVDLPYLRDWRYPKSDLQGLIRILTIVLGDEPPVFSSVQSSFHLGRRSRILNIPILRQYKYSDLCKRDISNAILQYKDLRPGNDGFTFNDGSRKDLVKLDGTIPVIYKGNTYNIPICIWILDTYPENPPMVFVKPTSTMQIIQGRNVDANGKVDLPYLQDWRYPQADLLGLIQILVIVFGEEPPMFSRSK